MQILSSISNEEMKMLLMIRKIEYKISSYTTNNVVSVKLQLDEYKVLHRIFG